ncbi:MAG TPA: nuclear transport factor 2 family protein [Thermoanaerobaculia bacterium]|nr:nuclear transport factor 2 family protein [Thermoanaerobaculia bacterium]
MPIRLAVPLALLLCFAATSARAQTAPSPPSPMDPLAVVQRFVEGFNRHDPGAMIAQAAPEVQWLSVAGDRIVPDAAGQTALRDWMAKYLSVYPTMRKTIEQSIVHAPFVSAWERDRWKGKDGGERTQAQLVIYQVEEGKIQRIWRYPYQP